MDDATTVTNTFSSLLILMNDSLAMLFISLGDVFLTTLIYLPVEFYLQHLNAGYYLQERSFLIIEKL